MAYKEEQTYLTDSSEGSDYSEISVASSVIDEDCSNMVSSDEEHSSLDGDEQRRPRKQRSSRAQKRSSRRFYGVESSFLYTSAQVLVLGLICTGFVCWIQRTG